MKGIRCFLSLLLCFIFATLHAQQTDEVKLFMNDCGDGRTWDIAVHLENSQFSNYTAFQMDLDLPEGFMLSDGSDWVGGRIAEHSLTMMKLKNGKIRIIGYSPTNQRINGTTGELFKLKLEYTKGEIPIEEYQLNLFNIIFSNRDGSEQKLSDVFIRVFTVVYMSDGDVYKYQAVQEQCSIPSVADPVKEGHTFREWSDLPQIMPASHLTVTALFTTNTYLLTYLVDGVLYKTVNVLYGNDIVPESAPEKEGYTFSVWEGLPAKMPARNLTVSSLYIVNVYTITYQLDGLDYKTVDVEYGKEIIPEPAPVREGHTFGGWSEIPQYMPAEDITVKGSFAINTYTITYMLDGYVYKTVDVLYGEKIVLEPAPTKEGHTFCGWSESPVTMPAGDVMIEGSFVVNTYTITYMLNNKEFAKQQVKYGEPIVPLKVEDTIEERFLGWEDMPETMPAHDIIVRGKTELTGVENLTADRSVEVYTINGVLVVGGMSWLQARQLLTKGLYVVNGKLVYVK